MYIEKLTINNFRCFGWTEVELNYPGRAVGPTRANVNLFVGGNGSGKSSFFKALALAVLSPIIQSSGLKAEYLVRRRPIGVSGDDPADYPASEVADVLAHLKLANADADILTQSKATVAGQALIMRQKDTETILLVHQGLNPPDPWARIYENASPAFFLVGYGASRRTERPEGYSEQSRSPRYQRVASLFEEQVGLVPFTFGHLQLQSRGRLDEARAVLNALLAPEGVTLSDATDGQGRPLFDCAGVRLPFDALSDGFRAFIGWVWDLLLQMARVLPPNDPAQPLTSMAGVVVVDEIDLFLHPEWQRRVVAQVADAFPRLQFLFSTHSPLVAGTLEAQNIYVLETRDGNAVVAQYQENIYGQTANQVLTSSYFGLHSTRAPGAGSDELSHLALSEDEADQAAFLERMTQAVPQP